MRSGTRSQIGLALGAWGAVQTTAAGVAIAVGGAMRDGIMYEAGPAGAAADAYTPVFALELVLLIAAIFVAKPLLANKLDGSKDLTHSNPIKDGPKAGLPVTDV